MRLLIVQPMVAPAKGGAQGVAATTARGLALRGHDVHLAGDYAALPDVHRSLVEAGVTVHAGRLHAGGPRAFWWLRALVDRVRPDLVQSALRSGDIAAAAATTGRRIARVAVVQERLPTGHDEARPSRAKSWLHRRALRGSALLIATSAYCRDHALAYAGLPPDRAVVVPNGIETARFALPPSARTANPLGLDRPAAPTVLLAGRLSPEKRPGLLLAVVERLLPRFPDLNAVLVGDGTLRAPLEAEARVRGIAGHVTFAGTHGDMPAVYAAADAVMHACAVEGFGLVPAEAMAAARPVVATGAGGVLDVVEDGVTGYLVPPGADEVDGFAERLAAVLDYPAHAAALGMAGRARVTSTFTVDAMLDGYEAAYERALGVG